MKKILFYIAQEYYWPSLEPIYKEFEKDGNYDLYLSIGKNQKRFLYLFLISQKKNIENVFKTKGYKITNNTEGFDAVFCGAQVRNPKQFGNAKLINVDHGPGIKSLRYRHLLKQKDTKYICFVEGKYRMEKFRKYGLDKIHDVFDTGLPKLDKFFNGYFDRNKLIEEYNLDKNKKTVLYAPSYKPTSIFLVGHKIASLLNKYNVIVKLHPYSWSGKYASHSHHRFFERLQKKHSSLHLVSPDKHDIMPYMFVADTMISDGSSVINEFLSLEKCGIIINLPEETHSDGKSLLENESSEWLKDSFIHINPDEDIHKAVDEAINPNEERKLHLKKDKEYVFSHTDGNSANKVKSISEKLF